MDPILIGIAALGVAVLGLLAHAWVIIRTRTASFAMLWVMIPLTAAAVAFTIAPANLTTLSLGGTALVLAVITLLTPLVVPALLGEAEPEEVESR
jgi:hypothetical protein